MSYTQTCMKQLQGTGFMGSALISNVIEIFCSKFDTNKCKIGKQIVSIFQVCIFATDCEITRQKVSPLVSIIWSKLNVFSATRFIEKRKRYLKAPFECGKNISTESSFRSFTEYHLTSLKFNENGVLPSCLCRMWWKNVVTVNAKWIQYRKNLTTKEWRLRGYLTLTNYF